MLILCVLVSKILCGIYVLVCVLGSVLVCGLFVDSFCAVVVYLWFWCVYSMEQVLVLGHFVTLARSVSDW
jgi:hypothetical protein